MVHNVNSTSSKNDTQEKEKWSKKDFFQLSTTIITFVIALIAFWQATISNKATNATLRQVIAFEKSQAAFLTIFRSNVIQNQWRNFIEFTINTEIINTNAVAAKNIEIKSRTDLLEKDFIDDQISYPDQSLKKRQFLSNINELTLENKIDTTINVSDIDKISNIFWPYLHLNIAYDDGFDNRIITNIGFRYDIHSSKKYECKHTNIKKEK